MDNRTVEKGIATVIVFVGGLMAGWFVWPDEVIVEKTLEVEKIVQLQATNQGVYDHCVMQARRVLYTSFSEEPKDGVTAEKAQTFINDCFMKLAPTPITNEDNTTP